MTASGVAPKMKKADEKVAHISAAGAIKHLGKTTRLYQLNSVLDNEEVADTLGLDCPSTGNDLSECAFFSKNNGVLVALRISEEEIAIYKKCGIQHERVLDIACEIGW